MYKGKEDVKVATALLDFPEATAAHLNQWTTDPDLDIVDVHFDYTDDGGCRVVIFYRGEKED